MKRLPTVIEVMLKLNTWPKNFFEEIKHRVLLMLGKDTTTELHLQVPRTFDSKSSPFYDKLLKHYLALYTNGLPFHKEEKQ